MDEELRRLLEAVQARLAVDAAPAATVAELCDAYMRSPEFLAMRSRSDERTRIEKHIVRLLGPVRAAALTLVHVDDYRLRRGNEDGCRKVDGVRVKTAPATRNREIVRLVRVLNWSVERKLLPENPIASAPLEPEENTRRTSLEEADMLAMRDACDEYKPTTPRVGLTLRAMISTAFDSGLRRAELCGLRRERLHVRDGLIELHELDTKGRKGRVTILSDVAAADMRAMPRDLRFKDSPFVFLTSRGKPYHPRTYLRMFQEIAALAGVEAAPGERVWAHDTRAAFVGQQLDLGTPEREIMDMTGHTTREVFDRYNRRRGTGAVQRAGLRLAERRAAQRAEPTGIPGALENTRKPR